MTVLLLNCRSFDYGSREARDFAQDERIGDEEKDKYGGSSLR
jgi:hypothetical protein